MVIAIEYKKKERERELKRGQNPFYLLAHDREQKRGCPFGVPGDPSPHDSREKEKGIGRLSNKGGSKASATGKTASVAGLYTDTRPHVRKGPAREIVSKRMRERNGSRLVRPTAGDCHTEASD